jgi:hypothetical protein
MHSERKSASQTLHQKRNEEAFYQYQVTRDSDKQKKERYRKADQLKGENTGGLQKLELQINR